MKNTIQHHLRHSLRAAAQHNRNTLAPPEVILWPDPERQWESILPALQKKMPELLVLGDYDPEGRQGPVIWIKTLVSGALGGGEIPKGSIPVIYLPGLGKHQLKRLGEAELEMQPLLEYYYTGNIWQHRNGKEWTVSAFLQNTEEGMGLNLAQDQATRDAILTCLPLIFEDAQLAFPDQPLNAAYFRSLLFPNLVQAILSWLNEGEIYLERLPKEKAEIFAVICQEEYGFEPKEALRQEAAGKLGSQKNNWRYIWDYFAIAPSKFPVVQDLLRKAKPADLGSGMFALPEDSWPQVNEKEEDLLRNGLDLLKSKELTEVPFALEDLELRHARRRSWVWAELGKAPLANALPHLLDLARYAVARFPFGTLEEMSSWYETEGYKVDQSARNALALLGSRKDHDTVAAVIRDLYLPWLEEVNSKFQGLVAGQSSSFTGGLVYEEQDRFILFVDALRFELGLELASKLRESGMDVEQRLQYCALPTLTATSKPAVSPIADQVSAESAFLDFRPQSLEGKDLTTANFRALLETSGYQYYVAGGPLAPNLKYWQAIGDIDSRGHDEGAKMVKRVGELFNQIIEAIENAFDNGFGRVRIVTDHGWLLVPGGLPKATLSKDLAATRWGRCAFIKDRAKTDFMQIPWRWNPGVFIAYAPGISHFKANEDYAHGGISLQECLVPNIIVNNLGETKATGRIKSIKWINLLCKVEVEGMEQDGLIDIRTKFSDPSSSKILPEELREKKGVAIKDGKCTIMVEDSVEDQAVSVVLLNKSGMILDKRFTNVGEI